MKRPAAHTDIYCQTCQEMLWDMEAGAQHVLAGCVVETTPKGGESIVSSLPVPVAVQS